MDGMVPKHGPKVLFVSHDASRTGAPFLLLHFLRWARQSTDLQFEILLRSGGPLLTEFSALARTHIFDAAPTSTKPNWRGHRKWFAAHLTKFKRNRLKHALSKESFDLIYSNTAMNGFILEFLSFLHCPIVSHVHELESVLSQDLSAENLERLFRYTNRFVAGSKAAKNNLVKNHSVRPDEIDVIYEFLPTDKFSHNNDLAAPQRLRQALNLAADTLIVGAAGTTSWRKGPDLFVQLALAVLQYFPEIDVHFVWVGNDRQGKEFAQLQYDVEHSGLGSRVHFLGARPDYAEILVGLDIFVLLSREDCFPLVMLESALYSKPIVCFEEAGGAPEFVQDGCGFATPYLDIGAMAVKVVELLRSPKLRADLGYAAEIKARTYHDVSAIGPQIMVVIRTMLSFPKRAHLNNRVIQKHG